MKNHALAFDPTTNVSEAVAPDDNLSLEELVAQIQSSESYAEVSIREDAAEAIFEAMQQQNVTRAELARRLGKSRPYVTKVLSGEENLSLETLHKIFRALNCQMRLEFSPRSRDAQIWTPLEEEKCSDLRNIAGGGLKLPWRTTSRFQPSLVPNPSENWAKEALSSS